jgi:DNA polymerase-3 subunit gamma/tau
MEIDGASNNGVDAVREIREGARFLPSAGSRKIYIIDEVHMLTTAAFNALLKTLEEPPAHVLFVFATTESHKIPATILSRCQRYDFKRVTTAQIEGRLSTILHEEKITAEHGTLPLIAQGADGSMRDALSLLDQAIAFCGNTLTEKLLRECFGLLEAQFSNELAEKILSRKTSEALLLIERAYQQGFDLRVLLKDLIGVFHRVLLTQVGAIQVLGAELGAEERTSLERLAKLRTLEEVELIFQALHAGVETIARSSQPRITLDVLVLRCCEADALISLDTLDTTGSPALSVAPAPTVAPVPTPSSNVVRTWEGLIEHVKRSRPILGTLLEHAASVALPETHAPKSELKICYKPEESYRSEQLQSKLYSQQLAQLTQEYFGRPTVIEISLKHVTEESLAEKREKQRKLQQDRVTESARSHPIIREARALFGGELGPIELVEDEEGDHAPSSS